MRYAARAEALEAAIARALAAGTGPPEPVRRRLETALRAASRLLAASSGPAEDPATVTETRSDRDWRGVEARAELLRIEDAGPDMAGSAENFEHGADHQRRGEDWREY